MKKQISILIFISCLANFAISQTGYNKQYALTSQEKHESIERTVTKEEGDVLWSEDFTGGFPDGWSIIDLSDENMPWIWTTDTIDGCYTNDPWITSGGNPETGYMHMPADGYNTIPQFTNSSDGGDLAPNLIDVDSYFETPALEFLSGQAGVVLSFYTFYRYFTGMRYEVQVSNDYDTANPETAHWDIYLVNEDYLSEINDPARDEFRQINISATAANQANVVIRFAAHGSTHYVWQVDNVEISVPYDNNVALNNTWAFYSWLENHPDEITGQVEGYLQHGGYYYSIPKSQVDAFVGFQGAVQNFGANAQANVKMTTSITYSGNTSGGAKGTVVYTVDSELKDLISSQYDSLYGAADFTPEEWGYYSIDMEVSMDSEDGLPSNNKAHWEFIVDDSTYARCTDNVTSTVATRNWVGGGYDGDGLGVLFTIYDDVVVEAMEWYFAERNNDYLDYIENGDFTYISRIYGYNYDFDEFQTSPLISAALGIIQPGDTGTWIRSEFIRDGNAEYLAPGDYLVFIETNTGQDPDETPVGFYMGEDLTYAQPDGNMRLWNEASWSWVRGNPSFKLIIDAEDWINEGCDNLVYLNYDMCEGDSMLIGDEYYYDEAVLYDSVQNQQGCDSITITTLGFHQNYDLVVYPQICEGESYYAEGAYQTVSGTYHDYVQSVYGCDSNVVTNLSVNPNYEIFEVDSMCEGYMYFWHDMYLSSAGVYYDNIQTENGCDSIFELTLTYYSGIADFEISGTTSIEEYRAAVYTVPENENVSYSWEIVNANLISYPSDNSIELQWGVSGIGILYCTAFDNTGCSSNVMELTVNINATNIKTVTYKNNIKFYPNPFSEKATLEITNFNNKEYNLRIMDISFRVVRSINNITANKVEIDKGGLKEGFYIIEIQSENYSYKEKILIK